MKVFVFSVLLLLFCLFFISRPGNAQANSAPSQPSPNASPINPNATAEARTLLKQIDDISGHYTLTGQHNFPNHVSRWSDRVYDLTGKFPGIFGQDFGFSGGEDKDSVEGRPSMIEEVTRQYRNGAVIALTWHAVRPTDDEPVTFHDSVQGHLTDFEWDELLTPGTDINKRWVEQVDTIAGYLRQLQEAGVPVLFRPYHEMNGNWFWWGGRPGEKGSLALYRQLYDRFVKLHHLNNLVWVWNVNSPGGNAGPIESYFPGAQYADVVTMDIYGEFKQTYYTEILALAGNKPIALAEVGAMPSLDVLAQQPRWAYFMMWSGMGDATNPVDRLQAAFHSANLLNRGDAPFTGQSTAGVISVIAATPKATTPTVDLLNRLNADQGLHVLSGQRSSADTPSAASELVFQRAGKHPAIFATDLDTSPEAKASMQSVLDEAIRQNHDGSVIALRWMAPNPAGPDRAVNVPSGQDSRHRMLTDFEWKELLTPGTHLNQLWSEQVDAVSEVLKQLSSKGVAVVWSPYPSSNAKQFWWAGRSGVHGSAALYSMLFDRLVNTDHVQNLVWVWEAAPPGFGPAASGSFSDFFPGYLYVDALQLDVTRAESRFPIDVFVKSFSLGKPIGISIDGDTPDPAFFANESAWRWFFLPAEKAPQANDTDERSQRIRALYADPRVVSR